MDLIDAFVFNQVIIFVKSVQYAVKLAEILNKNAIPSRLSTETFLRRTVSRSMMVSSN